MLQGQGDGIEPLEQHIAVVFRNFERQCAIPRAYHATLKVHTQAVFARPAFDEGSQRGNVIG